LEAVGSFLSLEEEEWNDVVCWAFLAARACSGVPYFLGLPRLRFALAVPSSAEDDVVVAEEKGG
jgi:hypothetical protein